MQTDQSELSRIADITANLDAYIDRRAHVLAEELAVPMRAEVAAAEAAIALEVQRREDLAAEFRRQLVVLERRCDAQEAEVQAWRSTSDRHQEYWRGEHKGYCQGCHDVGVLVLSPCPTRKGGEEAIVATRERLAKRARAEEQDRVRVR